MMLPEHEQVGLARKAGVFEEGDFFIQTPARFVKWAKSAKEKGTIDALFGEVVEPQPSPATVGHVVGQGGKCWCGETHADFVEPHPSTQPPANWPAGASGGAVGERTAVPLPPDEIGFDEATETRWQQAIYELCKKFVGPGNEHLIDGGGCDSGDALDFTLSEISQTFALLSPDSRAGRKLGREKNAEHES